MDGPVVGDLSRSIETILPSSPGDCGSGHITRYISCVFLHSTCSVCIYLLTSQTTDYCYQLCVFPQQQKIAFYSYMSTPDKPPSTRHILLFDTVKTNVGGAYNSLGGVFTIPENGVYGFSYSVRVNS